MQLDTNTAWQKIPMIHRALTRLAIIAFLINPIAWMTSLPSQAQTNLPSSAEPSRIIDNLGEESESFDFEFITEITLPDSRQDIPREEAESIVFTIDDIVIQGAEAYDQEELKQYYSDILGTEISLWDFFKVSDEIEAHYRRDGFFLTKVFVPPQKLTDNTARLTVIEGYVNRIVLEGESGGVTDLIEQYLEHLIDVRPLTEKIFYHYTELVNEIPGVQAFAVLRRSATQRGASELIVTVSIDHYTAQNNIDNRNSKLMGPWSSKVSLASRAFTEGGETFQAGGVISADWDEQRAGLLRYSRAIGDSGLRLAGTIGYGTAEPGGELRADGQRVRGKVLFFKGDIAYPLWRSPRGVLRSFTLNAGFSYLNSKVKLGQGETIHSTYSKDRDRSIDLGVEAKMADYIGGVSSLKAYVHKGLSIFGSDYNGSFGVRPFGNVYPSRQDATTDFIKITAEGERIQDLFWGFNLYLAAKGQWSPNRLLSGQEFGVGGDQFGRGYPGGEIVGDEGFASKAEFRFSERFSDSDLLYQFFLLRSIELYTFWDFGAIWNHTTLNQDVEDEENNGRDTLASVGTGLRGDLDLGAINLGVNLEYVRPMTRPASQDAYQGKTNRVYFGLRSDF